MTIALSLIVALCLAVYLAYRWGRASFKADNGDVEQEALNEKRKIHNRVRRDKSYRDRVRDRFR